MTETHVIDHLRVRGAAQRGRAVGALLQRMPWPEVGPGRTVIIRRLAVRARWNDLEAALRASLDAAVRAAVSTGREDQVMVFESAPLLLARLADELARGTAAARWFWQGAPYRPLLAAARPVALARLLAANAPWLAATAAELAVRHTLSFVWRTLDPPGAAAVVDAFWSWIAGRLPASTTTPAPLPAPRLAPALLWRWSAPLAGLPPADPRVQLAALLVLAEIAPRRLAEGPRGPALAELAVLLTSPPVLHRVPERPPVQPVPVATVPPVPPGKKVSPASRPAAQEDPAIVPPATAQDELATAFAATLFLVNALDRRELAAAVAPWLDRPGGGWRLILALAGTLGLPADDPLAVCLAEEERLAAGGEPPPPLDVAPLAAQAAALYGEELWNPRLLAVRGRVRLTRSHLDVLLPLASARLDVRLSGLDFDPGWVPWLGRVITFHFVEGP